MSIRITSQPSEIAFVDNPMWVEFFSPTHTKVDAVSPKIIIRIDQINAGDYFKFSFKNPDTNQPETVKFTFSQNPDQSGDFLPDDNFTTSLDLNEARLPYLLLNKTLTTYYQVEYFSNNQRFEFTAKQGVSAMVVNTIITNTTSSKIDFSFSTAFAQPEYLPNHIAQIEVWLEKTYMQGDWYLVSSLEDTITTSGTAKFNISDILKSELECIVGINVPDLKKDVVYKNDNLRRYYVKYGDTIGYDTKTVDFKETNCKLARVGGITIEDSTKSDFFQYIQGCNRFLTWFDLKKKVHLFQKDWLSWMNYTNREVVVNVQLNVFFKDGSDSTYENINTAPITLKKWETLTIPVGCDQLSIKQIAPAKEPYKWSIAIADNDNDEFISNEQEYYLDEAIEHCKNQFIYINSLNQPEGMLTRGKMQTQINVKRSFAQKNIPNGFELINGQRFQFSEYNTTSYKVRTGYLSKTEVEAYQDILLHSRFYFIEDSAYIPVLVDGSSFAITECLTFLHDLEFNIEKSVKEINHSNVQRVPALSFQTVENTMQYISVDTNEVNITTFGSLELLDDLDNSIETIAYNAAENRYDFSTVLTKKGSYYYKVELTTAAGKVIHLSSSFYIDHQEFSITTNMSALFAVSLSAIPDTTVYYDLENGVGPQNNLVTAAGVLFSHTYVNNDVKVWTFEAIDLSKITALVIADDTVLRLNIENLLGLQNLSITNAFLNDLIDLSNFKNLIDVNLSANNISSIAITFMKDLSTLNLSNNNLPVSQIEALLLELWKYRALYINSPTIIITANPGAGGALSVTSTNIINGIGIYAAQGLVSDLGWTITT